MSRQAETLDIELADIGHFTACLQEGTIRLPQRRSP
jgi:hypothetical protein